MRVLGIDPGAQGALALLVDGELAQIIDMPVRLERLSDGSRRTRIDAIALAKALVALRPSFAFLEQVNARPGEGPVGAFAFGRNVGVVEGALGCAGLLATPVPPGNWQRAIGIRRDDKGDIKTPARMRAIQLYPGFATSYRRKMDDGRADATLLATYGWRQLTEL